MSARMNVPVASVSNRFPHHRVRWLAPICVLVCSPAFAQVPNTQNCEPEWIADLPPTDDMRDVVLVGTIAYVASSSAGLQIFDVSDLTAPSPLGSYDTPGNAIGLDVVGSIVYVADEAAGMQIIDVTDPTAPRLLATYDTPGAANDITIDGTTAYIADGDKGFHLVDITIPTSPSLLGSKDTAGFPLNIEVVGTDIFVADGVFGLASFDTSNPLAMTNYTFFDPGGVTRDVAVKGDYAYFVTANVRGELHIVDVSDPDSFVFIDTIQFDVDDDPWKLDIQGDTLYATFQTEGFMVFDISDPLNVTEIHQLWANAAIRAVSVDGDRGIVTDTSLGLRTVDLFTTPSTSFNGITPTTGIARIGNTVYWLESNQLVAHDMSDPSSPVWLGSVTLSSTPSQFVVDGDRAYALSSDAFLTIEIGDPTSMLETHAYSTLASGLTHEDIAVAGNRAATFAHHTDDGHDYAHFFDLSPTGEFTETGTYIVPFPRTIRDVEVYGDFLAISRDGANGLTLDISDPGNVTDASHFSIAQSAHIYKRHNYIFTRTSLASTGVRIIDISNPSVPVTLGQLENAIGPGAILGTTAFVKDVSTERLEIFDVSNLTTPVWIGSECFHQSTHEPFVVGHLYAASPGPGISVMDLTHLSSLFPPPADLNGDGIVNGADLGQLLGDWGPGLSPADLNNDGTVDGADLGLLLGSWGVI
ncbi:MAG: hypothetical protein ACF8GE_06020 [Phycisphaerales bacterium JB043]